MSKITFFKSLFTTDTPEYITVTDALSRIKSGASKEAVNNIRNYVDKEKRDTAKKNLPCLCFSGEFTERKDNALIQHSGFMILDFDDTPADYRQVLEQSEYCYACFLSPSGTGYKMLIRISNPEHHASHFLSIQKNLFPNCDPSGKNISRVCFESYDENIYINENAKVYTSIFKETFNTTATYTNQSVSIDDSFKNLVKWLTNKNNVFSSGNRNNYIFTLASACCRYGIHEADAVNLIGNEYLTGDTSFTRGEAERTIKSAYKSNASLFGNCTFDKSYNLVTTKSGLEIDLSEITSDVKVKDIIYSDDVKEDALRILMYGYGAADSTGVDGLDFKLRKGDITLLSGIGNYGKSTFLNYLTLTKSVKDGDKWCIFTPETYPPEEYYHDFVEMLKGRALNGHVAHNMSNEEYLKAYDWVGKHFFYCYPMDNDHTPEYILERFLEMIIKEKVKGVIIDPFNQMSNDYSKDGGRDDKYLERTLSMFGRFAKENGVYFVVVAHPKLVKKGTDGINYECPDVFDISGGAMWNNKMDNILIYHRPLGQSNPQANDAEFHKKKVRREKSVGKKGKVMLSFDFGRRRFFDEMGVDWLQRQIDIKKGVEQPTQTELPPDHANPYAGMQNNVQGLYKEKPF